MFFLLVVVMAGIVGPLIDSVDPLSMIGVPTTPPFTDWAFPLGTDQMGRDVLAGLIAGAKVSLGIGGFATALTFFVGITVGALASNGPPWLDSVLMRLTEIFQTVPTFLLLIVIVCIVPPSLFTIVIAISLVSWPTVSRVTRSEMLSLRRRDFVASCRLIGMGETRIVVTQLLPNCFSSLIVLASYQFSAAILAEAALSFMGLGDSNTMSWGRMIGEGRSALQGAWYLSAIPGIALLLTVLAANLVGEACNDVLNPNLKER
jgi:peptide/nickel transport system permease protein